MDDERLLGNYYRIIIARPERLVIKVNLAITEGWKPLGSAVKYGITGTRMAQSMTRS